METIGKNCCAIPSYKEKQRPDNQGPLKVEE
eukprot:CAMPEP_0172736740 /NCGR_PEP_ID=MMETSP1074-20121228/115838_1 /TAXON_ID=2916 /ORGANISM="Ceratium fusus, Strain PA161109" /LENGTH=30 /DNA_ID= /DNA_START= /DNA_END= /DNA_ORIENTATION=